MNITIYHFDNAVGDSETANIEIDEGSVDDENGVEDKADSDADNEPKVEEDGIDEY